MDRDAQRRRAVAGHIVDRLARRSHSAPLPLGATGSASVSLSRRPIVVRFELTSPRSKPTGGFFCAAGVLTVSENLSTDLTVDHVHNLRNRLVRVDRGVFKGELSRVLLESVQSENFLERANGVHWLIFLSGQSRAQLQNAAGRDGLFSKRRYRENWLALQQLRGR